MKVKLHNPVYRKGVLLGKGIHDWPFDEASIPKSATKLTEAEVAEAAKEAEAAKKAADDIPDTLSEMAKKAKGK